MRILGFSFLENCNRHRHHFHNKKNRKGISYRLKGTQLPTEGDSVTDWLPLCW